MLNNNNNNYKRKRNVQLFVQSTCHISPNSSVLIGFETVFEVNFKGVVYEGFSYCVRDVIPDFTAPD